MARPMGCHINILMGEWIPDDKCENFFGPLTGDDEWHEYPVDTTWPEIMVDLGLFPSRGQARKNGFLNVPPDAGWSMRENFGRYNYRICVLRVVEQV